jgi:hypothetical protein
MQSFQKELTLKHSVTSVMQSSRTTRPNVCSSGSGGFNEDMPLLLSLSRNGHALTAVETSIEDARYFGVFFLKIRDNARNPGAISSILTKSFPALALRKQLRIIEWEQH